MATEKRKSEPPLRELLKKEPYRFGFFQAVRLLRAHSAREHLRRRTSKGRFPVRFRSRVSLAFAPSEVVSLEARGDKTGDDILDTEMRVAFMGLADHEGVLPDHYTELILQRVRARDYALRDFLDMFNDRLLQLFYRAWERPRFYLPYERGEKDPLSAILFSLMGLGTTQVRQSTRLPTEPLLYFAGLLCRRPLSIEASEVLLRRFLGGLPFQLVPFSGQWLELDENSRCLIGVPGAANLLGSFSPLGSRVWDLQGRIKVRLGPLDKATFMAFSPGGRRAAELDRFLGFMAGGEIDVVTELILEDGPAYGGCLGDDPKSGCQLGINSWLGETLTDSVLHMGPRV